MDRLSRGASSNSIHFVIHDWRAFGVHSLIASLAAAVLIVLMNMAFMPDAALWELASQRPRRTVTFIEILAWYVVAGWRLFRGPRSGAPVGVRG